MTYRMTVLYYALQIWCLKSNMASTQNEVDSVQEMKQGFTLLKRQA